jgi:hypothetical protein
VWVELGKLCFYTSTGEITAPKSYFFVGPKGCGSRLSTLLRNPEKLRSELIANWDKYCTHDIRTEATPLDGPLLRTVQTLDFSIFKSLSPLKVIEQHRTTPWHVSRFGAGLPERPDPPPPPDTVDVREARYVEQLFSAYSDHVKSRLNQATDFGARSDLREHFQRSREQFYYAEALKTFSRDTLPPGQFERLQKEILDGVIDVATTNYPDGLERLRATIKQSLSLQITSHALASRMYQNDRCGICHQLANLDKLLWVR